VLSSGSRSSIFLFAASIFSDKSLKKGSKINVKIQETLTLVKREAAPVKALLFFSLLRQQQILL
jgi:hypothetical protein